MNDLAEDSIRLFFRDTLIKLKMTSWSCVETTLFSNQLGIFATNMRGSASSVDGGVNVRVFLSICTITTKFDVSFAILSVTYKMHTIVLLLGYQVEQLKLGHPFVWQGTSETFLLFIL